MMTTTTLMTTTMLLVQFLLLLLRGSWVSQQNDKLRVLIVGRDII